MESNYTIQKCQAYQNYDSASPVTLVGIHIPPHMAPLSQLSDSSKYLANSTGSSGKKFVPLFVRASTLLARSEDRAQSSRESSTFLAKSQADHREAEGSRKSSKVEAEAEEVDEEYVPSPPRKRGRPAKNQSNGSN